MDLFDRENKEGGKPTGLAFEVVEGEGGGFSFETELDVAPEVDVKALTVEPETPIEAVKPPVVTDYFVDTPLDRPAYIPTFTEVSETFRMREGASRRNDVVEPKVNVIDVDATSEEVESAPVTHVVVTQSDVELDEPKDESITIIKFASDEPKAKYIPKVEELTPEPVIEVELEPEPVLEIEPEPEIVAEPEVVEEEEIDILFDENIHFIDYTEYDGDSESLSPEEAPLPDGVSARFGEYTKPTDKDNVKDGFLDKLMSVRIRLVFSAVIAAIMLVFDITNAIGIDLFALVGLGGFNYAHLILDTELAAILFLLAIPEFIYAVRQTLKKVISPELILLPSILAVVSYSAIAIVTEAKEYSAFGIFLALETLLAIIGSQLRVKAEFSAFKIISKNAIKNILDKRLTRTLGRENIALDGAIDEYKSKIARMFHAGFISDFMARVDRRVENSFNVLLTSLASLGIAVITAIVTYFLSPDSVITTAGAFTLVFLLSFPAFSILTHKLPYYRSIAKCEREGGTFVGEESLYSCSDIDVIAYEDVEIFGEEDVTVKKMDIYDKHDITRVLTDMRAIFAAVGGPLDRIFSATIDNVDTVADEVYIEDDGVSGMVDGRRVFVGTREYLSRYKITVPGQEPIQGVDSTRVMYGAAEGKVFVRYIVRYSFSEEFAMLLPYLKEEGIIPLIYTRDPNISTDFLKILTSGEDAIRVMKKLSLHNNDDKVYRRVSAGIVTLGEKINAINMVLLSKKYVQFQDGIKLFEIISMILSSVIAVLFAVTGSFNIPAVLFVVLQIAWCLYLGIRTHTAFKDRKEDKEN